MDGNVKTVTIRKTPTQQWFVSIVCEDVPTHHLPPLPECVGIDGGLKTFAMLSNGRSIDNPKFYQTEQMNLAKVQHRLSLCEMGSIDRQKAKKVVCRVHERISNKREDVIQTLSRILVNQYGMICFEDLNIQTMTRNPAFTKGILDAPWSKLVHYTTCKAEDAGGVVVLVNPRNPFPMGSRCRQIGAQGISVRVHNCPHCG